MTEPFEKINVDPEALTAGVFVARGGAYLLDEQAGVLIDSAGNFSAKTKGDPRALVVLLRSIAEYIEGEIAEVDRD